MPMKDFEEGVQGRPQPRARQCRTFSTGKVGLGFNINQPAPIYVSAEGPKGLQLAGRCADGVILGTGFDLSVYDWAKQKIREGAAEVGTERKRHRGHRRRHALRRRRRRQSRKIVRNRLANRAHHNFRFTYETVPPDELDGVKKLMAGFDVMKPMEDRVDPDLVNDYLVRASPSR